MAYCVLIIVFKVYLYVYLFLAWAILFRLDAVSYEHSDVINPNCQLFGETLLRMPAAQKQYHPTSSTTSTPDSLNQDTKQADSPFGISLVSNFENIHKIWRWILEKEITKQENNNEEGKQRIFLKGGNIWLRRGKGRGEKRSKILKRELFCCWHKKWRK